MVRVFPYLHAQSRMRYLRCQLVTAMSVDPKELLRLSLQSWEKELLSSSCPSFLTDREGCTPIRPFITSSANMMAIRVINPQ